MTNRTCAGMVRCLGTLPSRIQTHIDDAAFPLSD